MTSSSISVADRFSLLKDKVDSITNNLKKPPIGMAFMLRDSNEKYFEPRISAIGPVHHNKKERYKHAEDFKMVFAYKFIDRSSCSCETLFNAIKKEIETFKICYMEDVRNKYQTEEENNELAWMLLIDGCAVLQFILSAADKTLKEILKNDLAAFSKHDIFLLENQLPFDLLELLMKNHKDRNKILSSIEDFIDTNMAIKPKEKMDLNTSRPVHLLDLLRTRMLQCPQPTSKHTTIPINDQDHPTQKGAGTPSNKNDSSCAGTPSNKNDSSSAGTPSNKNYSSSASAPSKNWQTFRSISQLKRAGINVKPSETSCLKDFDFEEGNFWYGTVILPSITVDDVTAAKFLNIIAYEMLPQFQNEGEVSSYICQMDSLIDHADDVKELRNAKVLHNMLGSDDEVAQLFNVISKDLVPNFDAYAKFRRKIQDHYDNECKTTFAQGFHDHFSTPWTRIAFAGAVIGLILSFLQALTGFLIK